MSFLLFLLMLVGNPWLLAPQTTPAGDLAAYLLVDANLLNASSGDSNSYECFVQFTDKARRHSRLRVLNAQTKGTVLEFDPFYNSLIRIFPEDVTNDGHVELISEWTHGNNFQVAIHTFWPTPKLIFQKSYRYGISFCTGPDLKARIQVTSGSSVEANITVEELLWSAERSEFVLESAREYPPTKQKGK
jgi:hypothetical protein